jgi:hypothetical protein
VATQTDIQRAFQLLQEPVNEKKRVTILIKEIYLKGTTLRSKFETVGFITQWKKQY